jgi:hypothetical protein
MHEIYSEVQHKKQVNKENGKKGGRKKQTVNRNESESKPDGLYFETETKAILINNNKESINKERETPPIFYAIEHCLTVALNDDRWVRANKATKEDLQEFNSLLEKRGHYEKNPADYKTHFANWKNSGKKDVEPLAVAVTSVNLKEQKALKILNG